MDIEQVYAVMAQHEVSVVGYDGELECMCGWEQMLGYYDRESGKYQQAQPEDRIYDEHLKAELRKHFG